ncbi:MAG TPA: MurR/RpiR family transcriptional regulator [Terriglobia bacterium]|nr:MurR/RpiR family transcriptional regulator [Terriglobia bacterium]
MIGHPRTLLPVIQGRLPTFKKAQRRIAEAAIKDPEQFIAQSIAEVAERCGVSPGSIVIFCKSLGLKGFPALKMAIARELSEQLFASPNQEGGRRGAPAGLQKVLEEHIKALQDTVRLNTPETLASAVKLLAKSRRTVLFSIGLSYPVAYSLYARMRFIGIPAQIEYDSHLQLAAAAEMRPGEAGIGVSLAGSTRETVECLRLAKSQGAKTVCITNSIDSLLAQTADVRLYAAPSEVKYFQAPLASRVTQLAVADALVVELGVQRRRRALAHLRRAEEHLLQRRMADFKGGRR